MVRITFTCFFSQPDVLTVTNLDSVFAKDLLGTISKKTGISFMYRRVLEAFHSCTGFLIFKNLAHILQKRDISLPNV